MILKDNKLTKELITKVLKKKNYKVSNKRGNLNIVGIRAVDKPTGLFNDRILLFYKDEFDDHYEHVFKVTTKPGQHWLGNLLNKKGTAILVPGQYLNSYIIGKHQGKYDALTHRGKNPVKVYRDNNLDTHMDMLNPTIEEGYFGINIHRASSWKISEAVGKWSAGCQVFKSHEDFKILMDLANEYTSKQVVKDFFTYTLLDEIDIINEIGDEIKGLPMDLTTR